MKKSTVVKQCTVEGCNSLERKLVRGCCRKHYRRLLRYGDPRGGSTELGAPLNWFLEQLAHGDRSVCWDWPYFKGDFGYGQIVYQGRKMTTHVLALILDGKPQPEPPNHWAIHSCDNPPCFNPAHLRWGTTQDNHADMVRRGRIARGDRQHDAKLTEEAVRRIRQDSRSLVAIAKDYGVSPSAIHAVKQRRSWKWVA